MAPNPASSVPVGHGHFGLPKFIHGPVRYHEPKGDEWPAANYLQQVFGRHDSYLVAWTGAGSARRAALAGTMPSPYITGRSASTNGCGGAARLLRPQGAAAPSSLFAMKSYVSKNHIILWWPLMRTAGSVKCAIAEICTFHDFLDVYCLACSPPKRSRLMRKGSRQ